MARTELSARSLPCMSMLDKEAARMPPLKGGVLRELTAGGAESSEDRL